MKLSAASMIALSGVLLVTGCSTAPYAEVRDPKAQRELANALAGRTAQAPVRCLPNYRTTQMEVIDDWTILYRAGRTTYVQNPRGGCRGLGNGGYTMVNRQYGTNQLCDGDFSELIDLRTGVRGGACIFGPFTPYTRMR